MTTNIWSAFLGRLRAAWQRSLTRRKSRKEQRRRRPTLELLEDRAVPATFAPGSINGQDFWSGGTLPIAANVYQTVDQGGSNAHAGVGSWLVSNSTINGGYNGNFAGWPFSPGLSVTAGQPSSGAQANQFNATYFFKSASAIADGSNIEIDLGTSNGLDRNTFMALTNKTDGDGGLQIRMAESNVAAGAGNDYFYATQSVVTNITRGAWHRIDVQATFIDGASNDTFQVLLDGVVITNTTPGSPNSGTPNWGTFEGYREGHGFSYALSNRLFFRSGAAPSSYGSFSDSGAQGFYIDDVSYRATTQADPTVTLASYAATFEPATPTYSTVYVDDSWAGTAVGVDPDGAGPATHFGYDAFSSIQDAINAAADGGTINVAAGTYVENVVVNHAVTLAGAGQGASIVRPAISSITGNPLAGSAIFRVQSSDVHITGFTLDGDNTALTSGVIRGGADVDATAGIVTAYNVSENYDNLEIDHVTVKNIYLRGIQARMTGTFIIHDNVVDNVQGDVDLSIGIFNRNGGGIISGNTVSRASDAINANHSRGTQFLNNTITLSQSGIHTDNSRDSGGTSTDLIAGNSVSLGDRMSNPVSYGIWAFVPYQNVTIQNNTVSGVDIGIGAYGQGVATGTVTIDHNSVDLGHTAGSIGVDIRTTIPSGFGQANVAASLINGNIVRNAATGVSIYQDPGFVASVSITSTTFTGDALDIVNASTGALTPAGNNVFDGVTLSSATTAQMFAIADKIVDAIDVSGYGLVRLKAGNIYVTPNSFFAPTTATPSIQRGIDMASAGDIVNVAAGAYQESVMVNKSVTVLGAQAGLNPTSRTNPALESIVVAPSGTNGFSIGASNVTVRGFTVTTAGGGVYGIAETTPVTGTVIDRNIVSGFAGLGIALAAGSSGAMVTENDVSNNYAGIYLSTGASNVTVRANVVHDNSGTGFPDAGSGIVFEGNNINGLVSQNFIRANAGSGIYVWHGYGNDFSSTKITSNSITGNDGAGFNNTSATVIDAADNWWGANTAAGVAAEIGANVDYVPWLTTGADVSADPGFQGDFTLLTVNARTLEVTPMTINVPASDNAVIVTRPAFGAVVVNANGTITYTPTFAGADAFTYKISDGTVVTVSVTVDALPPGISIRGSEMFVSGSENYDNIVIRRQGPNGLLVTSLIDSQFESKVYFQPSGFTVIRIDLHGGDDRVTIAPGVTLPVHVVGGAGNDTITTSVGNDVVYGDAIDGSGNGDDTIITGAGNDFVNAGNGNNYVAVGYGNNTVLGGAGVDQVRAANGNNDIRVGDGDNNVRVALGSNTIVVGNGANFIQAGNGNNRITAGNGANSITTGAGIDTIVVGDGANFIQAGNGANTVTAGNGANYITTGTSADVIRAGNGRNWVSSGAGNDRIVLGDGGNFVLAGDGADVVVTGAGSDSIYGGTGDDLLLSGAGNDNVQGGLGNDVLVGGLGSDYVAGEDGRDLLFAGAVDLLAPVPSPVAPLDQLLNKLRLLQMAWNPARGPLPTARPILSSFGLVQVVEPPTFDQILGGAQADALFPDADGLDQPIQ